MASGRIILDGFEPVIDTSGNAVAGATLHIYLNGTTTPAAVFQDPELTVAALNPQVSTAAGYFRAQSTALYVATGQLYTVRLTYPGGAVVTRDDVVPETTTLGLTDFAQDLLAAEDATEALGVLGIANLPADVANTPPGNNAPQASLENDRAGGVLPVSALTLGLVTDQLIASGTAALLALKFPLEGAYGAGDEGFTRINGVGFDDYVIPAGYNVTDSRAWNLDGTSWSGAALNFPTSPPRAEFLPNLAAGTVVWVQRKAGAFFRSGRMRSLRLSIAIYGSFSGGAGLLRARALVNGTATGNSIEVPISTSVQASLCGHIDLMNVPNGAEINIQVLQSNGAAADLLLIGAQTSVTVTPIHQTAIRAEDLEVVGIHQGAPFNTGDLPEMANMDSMFVSNVAPFILATSGATARGQLFWDGYISGFVDTLPDLKRQSAVSRPLTANPRGRRDYAYISSSVVAPAGSFAGQATYDRFPTPAGMTTFNLSKAPIFIATGGGFGSSVWLQTIEADGQRLIAYGAVWTLSGGVYTCVTEVLGKTYTLELESVSGTWQLRVGLATPFVTGDYVGVAHSSNLLSDPWTIDDGGRDRLRQVLTRTFSNQKMRWDGLFIDLAVQEMMDADTFSEVARICRPYGPMIFNITRPSARGVDFVAQSPWVQSGDGILLEGAYLSGGADTSAITAEAIAAVKRWGNSGKELKVFALATIEQNNPGPPELDARIINAAATFSSTARRGWAFGCHWANLGNPFGSTPRPMPGRVAGIGGWS